MTGHLLGASGVVEAIIAIMTLRDQTLPPTLNLEDNEFPDWDIVAGHDREMSGGPDLAEAAVNTVLSTSFGFGGHNGAIILRRPHDPSTKERR